MWGFGCRCGVCGPGGPRWGVQISVDTAEGSEQAWRWPSGVTVALKEHSLCWWEPRRPLPSEAGRGQGRAQGPPGECTLGSESREDSGEGLRQAGQWGRAEAGGRRAGQWGRAKAGASWRVQGVLWGPMGSWMAKVRLWRRDRRPGLPRAQAVAQGRQKPGHCRGG